MNLGTAVLELEANTYRVAGKVEGRKEINKMIVH